MPGALKVKVGGVWVDVGGAGPPGPPGPQGPEGPPGSGEAAGTWRHVQTAPNTVWTILHNLGYFPNVSAVDSTGREIWAGDVVHIDTTTVELTFSASVAGEAYLS